MATSAGGDSTQDMVAIVADAALFPAAIFLASRLADLAPPQGVAIAIFSDSLADLSVARQWGAPCELYHCQTSVPLPTVGRISGATFYRLFLPRLSGARRLLYLDVDTYPESDLLWRLFDLDMGGLPIAAVRDFERTCSGSRAAIEEIAKSGHPRDGRYINAGVLLIDVAAYQAANLEQRFLGAAIRHNAHDQQAINLVLEGEVTELSPAFNMTPLGLVSPLAALYPPVVTHFMGGWKPWRGPLFGLPHRARGEIEKYLPATPWRSFLSRHYGLADAMAGKRAEPPVVPPGFPARARAYALGTRFADVEQGLYRPAASAAEAGV